MRFDAESDIDGCSVSGVPRQLASASSVTLSMAEVSTSFALVKAVNIDQDGANLYTMSR